MLRDKVRELLRDYCVDSRVDGKFPADNDAEGIMEDLLIQSIVRFDSAAKRERTEWIAQKWKDKGYRFRLSAEMSAAQLGRFLKPGIFLSRDLYIPPNAEVIYVQYNPKRETLDVMFDTTYDGGPFILAETQEPVIHELKEPLDLAEASDKELLEVIKDPSTGFYLVELAQRVLDMYTPGMWGEEVESNELSDKGE